MSSTNFIWPILEYFVANVLFAFWKSDDLHFHTNSLTNIVSKYVCLLLEACLYVYIFMILIFLFFLIYFVFVSLYCYLRKRLLSFFLLFSIANSYLMHNVWSFLQPIPICCIMSRPQLVSAIFYHILIFSRNIICLLKNIKYFFIIHRKSSFRSRDIQMFVFFPLPFHSYKIQKDKWKWNNLRLHKLACINLRMQLLE